MATSTDSNDTEDLNLTPRKKKPTGLIIGFIACFTLSTAIGDLGELIPKSADCETTYQYQMDLALKSSMERASLLRLLKTGAPKEQSQSLPAQSADK